VLQIIWKIPEELRREWAGLGSQRTLSRIGSST